MANSFMQGDLAYFTSPSSFTMLAATMYQCGQCGKSYKHKTCLSKHLWEHSEHWETVMQVLPTASKHQVVQMMEAAHILLSMSTSS
jgi:predicted amidophosphoribosyltransferase